MEIYSHVPNLGRFLGDRKFQNRPKFGKFPGWVGWHSKILSFLIFHFQSLVEHFFLFKLTMRKLERKWTFKNKLLFKFPRKNPPKPRKNNSKSRAYSNNCCNFFPKINSQRKTGLNLENFWKTDFRIFSQNRPKFGRPKFGIWLYIDWRLRKKRAD